MNLVLDCAKWLFDTTGIMWVVIILILWLRVVDKIGGKPLEGLFKTGGPLHAEYYPSLWAKYHDPDYYRYMEERAFAYDNYKHYIKRAVQEQGLITWWLMRKAKKRYDYKTLYNLEQDIDGHIENYRK